MFTSLGVALSVFERGAGMPVVCVHGALGAGAIWGGVAKALASAFRVIAPDLFGDGSTPTAPRAWSSFDADVLLVESVIAQIGSPVHLVGHSYGATLALDVAIRQRASLQTLTVLEPNGLGDAAAHLDALGTFDAFRAAMDASEARHRAGDDEGAAQAIVEMAQGANAWTSIPRDRRPGVARNVGKLAARWEETIARAPRIADAAIIDVPTLAIAGTEGPIHARWSAAKLADAIPHARFVELEGAGHMAPLTHPRAIADAFVAFAGARPHMDRTPLVTSQVA